MSNALFLLLGLGIGIYIGFRLQVEQVKNDLKKVGNSLEEALFHVGSDLQAGIIKRPSAKQIADTKVDERVKQGRQAMVETLDQIPELRKAKEQLEGK